MDDDWRVYFDNNVEGNGVVAMKKMKEENAKKKDYIDAHQDEWQQTGQMFRQRRKQQKLSLISIGSMLGTSATRISRFERGYPIQRRKWLQESYKTGLERNQLETLLLIYNIDLPPAIDLKLP